MADEKYPLSPGTWRDRERRNDIERKRLDQDGHPVAGGAFDQDTPTLPPDARDKAGKPKSESSERRPVDARRATGNSSEPWHRDESGSPEQPQDRPPARPHMTVTNEPEPSPHEVRKNMDED